MAGNTSGRFSRYPAVNRDGDKKAAPAAPVAKPVDNPVDEPVVEAAPAPKKPRKKSDTTATKS
jgi:hypothetical protein